MPGTGLNRPVVHVSHYRSEDGDFGRIDLVHAFRGPPLSMLERAERIEVAGGISLPVARTEDIVGLNVQLAGLTQPDLRPDERFVEQTTAGRQRYIEFATEAACFKGKKPVRFVGENWRL